VHFQCANEQPQLYAVCIKVSRDCNEIISIRMVSSIEAKIILLLEADSLPPMITLLSLKQECILNATLLGLYI